MLISIALPTWNRSAVLRRALERFTHFEPVDGVDWELLVVDNNSTDDTQTVLAEFATRLPLRPLREPAPGKSNAANLAVREARGEYILWTDDDVFVGPNWLSQYVAAFRRYPDADVFGGPIDPWLDGTPPQWLVEGLDAVAEIYGALDLKRPEGPAPESFYPFGGNMALKRSAHLRHAFDPSIGPQAGTCIPGEEWILVRALRRAGSQVVWVADARVQHFIPRARQTKAYLRRYYQAHGKMLAKMETKRGSGLWLGRPMWLWRQWLECGFRAQLGRFTSPPEQWLKNFGYSAVAWGWLRNYQREASLR
ncbi:MAG: glycosyl transferase family 2 [Gemmatimonadales bacterium]|jgi:GT2 family glycosyltransferase|nr:glycosyl transferase family 2 [Gemmatimonadales bacterium]